MGHTRRCAFALLRYQRLGLLDGRARYGDSSHGRKLHSGVRNERRFYVDLRLKRKHDDDKRLYEPDKLAPGSQGRGRGGFPGMNSAPIVVVGGAGGGAGARRAAARPHHDRTSETLGWLLLGGVAIFAIYWLTRRPAQGVPPAPNVSNPDLLRQLAQLMGLTMGVGEPSGSTVTHTVTDQGVGIYGPLSCYDPRYRDRLYANEYIVQRPDGTPQLCVTNGPCYAGCPNEVLKLRG